MYNVTQKAAARLLAQQPTSQSRALNLQAACPRTFEARIVPYMLLSSRSPTPAPMRPFMPALPLTLTPTLLLMLTDTLSPPQQTSAK